MIRQVLKGDGIAFIGAMGVLTHKVLAPGEKLIVDTCVEIKIYGAFSSSTPSARRLPDGVAMRFLAARPSQDGRVIAEK